MNTTLYARLPNLRCRALAIEISNVRDSAYPDGAEFGLIEACYNALMKGTAPAPVIELVDAARNHEQTVKR